MYVSHIAGRHFTFWATREALSIQSLQTQGLVLFCFPLIQKRESNTHTLGKKKIKTRERENSKT